MKISSFLLKNVRFAQYNISHGNHRETGVYKRGRAPEENKENRHGNNASLNTGGAPVAQEKAPLLPSAQGQEGKEVGAQDCHSGSGGPGGVLVFSAPQAERRPCDGPVHTGHRTAPEPDHGRLGHGHRHPH